MKPKNKNQINTPAMKSIFAYKSYRKYIQDFCKWKKKYSGNYSYKTLSDSAGYQSNSFIIDVVNKNKNISQKGIFAFGTAMGLSFAELNYFENLSHLNDCQTKPEKEYYKIIIERIKKKTQK